MVSLSILSALMPRANSSTLDSLGGGGGGARLTRGMTERQAINLAVGLNVKVS